MPACQQPSLSVSFCLSVRRIHSLTASLIYELAAAQLFCSSAQTRRGGSLTNKTLCGTLKQAYHELWIAVKDRVEITWQCCLPNLSASFGSMQKKFRLCLSSYSWLTNVEETFTLHHAYVYCVWFVPLSLVCQGAVAAKAVDGVVPVVSYKTPAGVAVERHRPS